MQKNRALEKKFGEIILQQDTFTHELPKERLLSLAQEGHAESALTLALYTDEKTDDARRMELLQMALAASQNEPDGYTLWLSSAILPPLADGLPTEILNAHERFYYRAATLGCMEAMIDMSELCLMRSRYAEAAFWIVMAYFHCGEQYFVEKILKLVATICEKQGDTLVYEPSASAIFTEVQHKAAQAFIRVLKRELGGDDPHSILCRTIKESAPLTEEDVSELTQLSLAGSTIAAYTLAEHFQHKKEMTAAYEACRPFADKGDAHSAHICADLLACRTAVEQHYAFFEGVLHTPEAQPLYELAAKHSDPGAMYILGRLETLRGNDEMAAALLQRAANRGMCGAEYQIYNILANRAETDS